MGLMTASFKNIELKQGQIDGLEEAIGELNFIFLI